MPRLLTLYWECHLKIAKRRKRLFHFNDPHQLKKRRLHVRQLGALAGRLRYPLDELLAQCTDGLPIDPAWENMKSVGRELI